jgi:hypothetical protein
MASIPDWITAGASLVLAVMAIITVNGTYKLTLPCRLRANHRTADGIEDRVAQQATVITGLQSRLTGLEASLALLQAPQH